MSSEKVDGEGKIHGDIKNLSAVLIYKQAYIGIVKLYFTRLLYFYLRKSQK